jgi:hypothetical protein
MVRNLRRRWIVSRLVVVGGLIAATSVAVPLVMPAPSFADQPTGCDFSNNGTSATCAAPIAGTTFAASDGNMLAPQSPGPAVPPVYTPCSTTASPPCFGPPAGAPFGTTDWQNVGNVAVANDLPSGSTDNGFGNGTSEDTYPQVGIVVNNNAANAGSDLTRMYEAAQFVGGHNFLYLAWERNSSSGGSVAVDFELNQQTQPASGSFITPGTATLNRTAGDLLVTYDFSGGGTNPTISLNRWVTSGSPTQCRTASAVPCWAGPLTSPIVQASVNNFGATGPGGTGTVGVCSANSTGCQVYDPNLPISPATNVTGSTPCAQTSSNAGDVLCRSAENPVPALRFGEVAIDLTASGFFGNTCQAFANAWVKARTSTSFNSALKDLIAPTPIYLSNCLQLSVGYQDNAGGAPSTRPPAPGLTPWGHTGDTGVVQGVANFVGCNQFQRGTNNTVASACPTDASLPAPQQVYDGGALLFTNTSAAVGASQSFTISGVSVVIGDAFNGRTKLRSAQKSAISCVFEPWTAVTSGPVGPTLIVPPGNGTQGSNQMILTQTGFATGPNGPPWGPAGTKCNAVTAPGNFAENFDTSETVPAANVGTNPLVCPQTSDDLVPVIRFSYPGPNGPLLVHTAYDNDMILNKGGVDPGCSDATHPGINETSLGGTGGYTPLS